MFALGSDASKVAFVALVRQLARWGVDLVDCQVHTEQLARFGATEWPRARFLEQLVRRVEKATRRGCWSFDADLATG
jgi:leucyl/phenylalanyl-tRNA--protein transferase